MTVQDILLLEKHGWQVISVSPVKIVNIKTKEIIENVEEIDLLIKNINKLV